MESQASVACFRQTLTHSREETDFPNSFINPFLSGQLSWQKELIPEKVLCYWCRVQLCIYAFVASFFFFSWTTQIDSLGDLFLFGPWTMRPLDDASLGRCVPWTMRPLDDASLERCVPWTMRPLDETSLHWTAYRRWVITTQLLAGYSMDRCRDDAFPTDVSPNEISWILCP